MIDYLIRSINEGASSNAGNMARDLAKFRANVQFTLLSKNDHQETNINKSRPDGDSVESPDSVLQLVLYNYLLFLSHLNA